MGLAIEAAAQLDTLTMVSVHGKWFTGCGGRGWGIIILGSYKMKMERNGPRVAAVCQWMEMS